MLAQTQGPGDGRAQTIVAPEELIADREARCTEDPSAFGFLGLASERLTICGRSRRLHDRGGITT
jgi:hypothetical protein